jgi:hypothetical protein
MRFPAAAMSPRFVVATTMDTCVVSRGLARPVAALGSQSVVPVQSARAYVDRPTGEIVVACAKSVFCFFFFWFY